MIDFDRKCDLIESGIVDKIRFFRKCEYNNTMTKDIYEDVLFLMDAYERDVIEDADKIVSSQNAVRKRLRRYIFMILTECESACFITLTFNNDALRLSPDTRKKYVNRFLSSFDVPYVANIDFGDKKKNPNSKEREHYHAVLGCRIDNALHKWKYGIINFKKITTLRDILNGLEKSVKVCSDIPLTAIKLLIKNKNALSMYVAKLSNHAIKECTFRKSRSRVALMYSRKWAKAYQSWLKIKYPGWSHYINI